MKAINFASALLFIAAALTGCSSLFPSKLPPASQPAFVDPSNQVSSVTQWQSFAKALVASIESSIPKGSTVTVTTAGPATPFKSAYSDMVYAALSDLSINLAAEGGEVNVAIRTQYLPYHAETTPTVFDHQVVVITRVTRMDNQEEKFITETTQTFLTSGADEATFAMPDEKEKPLQIRN